MPFMTPHLWEECSRSGIVGAGDKDLEGSCRVVQVVEVVFAAGVELLVDPPADLSARPGRHSGRVRASVTVCRPCRWRLS